MTRLLPLLLLTGCCYAPPYEGLNLTEAQKRQLPYVKIPAPSTIYLYPPRPAPIWGPDI